MNRALYRETQVLSTLGTRRFQSSISTSSFSGLPIRIVAIPLTSRKSFIYCHHSSISQLPGEDKTFVDKAIAKSTDIWNKFAKSDKKFNRKVISVLDRLLARIPWDETSLKSIPSADSIVRELKTKKAEIEDHDLIISRDDKLFVKQQDIIEKNVDLENDSLNQIPVFYPSSITNQSQLVEQLTMYATTGHKIHFRKLMACLIGLPFTVPFIALPVVPNLPGFYLCYRAYCHYTAIAGAKHLEVLINNDHLQYTKLDHGSLQIYESTKDQDVLVNLKKFHAGALTGEALLLGDDVVESICKSFESESLVNDVRLALAQEKAKIAKFNASA